ncbi:MAG: aminotransferase class V-fold PLP-dependent enzyme [Planctomycetes bacterium]|nr:aminotransferase class V-fold PLP-dependent enzyme [Planctomycetota bacterium]
MQSLLKDTFELAEQLLQLEQDAAPMPRHDVGVLGGQLSLELPQDGASQSDVFAKMSAVLNATPQTSSPRFLNQLFGGRQNYAAAADMLTALLNVSMYTYKAAGAQILVEQQLVQHMAKFAGFTDAEGVICPGGSMANFVGMMMGRDRANPNFREHGSDGRRHTFYVSEQSHYSVDKAAAMLGVGRANVRKIKCDFDGRMNVDDLSKTIETDIANGCVPCAVVATCGTTVLGAFDPLKQIASICRKHDIWLHADGAFGGAALLHRQHRELLDGIEFADSLSWDAHKVMGVPLTCSMLLCQHQGRLSKSVQQDAEYLFQVDHEDLNPGLRSIQCGRRNDAFKLWSAWQALGDNGWHNRLNQQFKLAKFAADYIEQSADFELCQRPEYLTICFKVHGVDVVELCDQLHASGEALIGHANVRGEQVMRLVVVNPEISTSDLQQLFENIVAKQANIISA